MVKVARSIALALGISMLSGGAYGQSTEDVWTHHIEAWENRDLEAIAADYSEESILILNNTVFSGPDEIKQAFQQLFSIFDDGHNTIDPPVLAGRVVYITWHFTPTGHEEFYGTDTFIIENGKIAVQTIASPLYDRFRIATEAPTSNGNARHIN